MYTTIKTTSVGNGSSVGDGLAQYVFDWGFLVSFNVVANVPPSSNIQWPCARVVSSNVTWTLQSDSHSTSPDDDDVTLYVELCASRHLTVWMVAVYIYKGLLLVPSISSFVEQKPPGTLVAVASKTVDNLLVDIRKECLRLYQFLPTAKLSRLPFGDVIE